MKKKNVIGDGMVPNEIRHFYKMGIGSKIKPAIRTQLNYEKCRIQSVWSLTYASGFVG